MGVIVEMFREKGVFSVTHSLVRKDSKNDVHHERYLVNDSLTSTKVVASFQPTFLASRAARPDWALMSLEKIRCPPF